MTEALEIEFMQKFIEITSDRKEKNKKANRQYLEMNIERAFCQFKK